VSKLSCAQAVVKALENEGVRHVFIGPPGEHVVELYDALLDSQQLKGYLTTNEYTLSFMADGYSRASGEVGVFTLVPGPGVTNALTGITEAFTDSVPIVGIISDVRAHIEESFQLHQIPNLEVLRPVIKKGFRITEPEQVPQVFAEAFQLARSGEPGPVMIEIPCDVYPMYAEMGEAKLSAKAKEIDFKKIQEFSKLIKSAKRCGIYIGRGCFDCSKQIKELSDRLQAPVASSVNGRGILPENQPLSVGFGFGKNGSKISQEVFKHCDTVLAIGCKFAEVSTGSYSFRLPQTLIHVDINPHNLNKVFQTDHTLACDAKLFLNALLKELGDFRRDEDIPLKKEINTGKEEFYREIKEAPLEKDFVDPGRFYLQLREKMAPRDTLTVDIGNHELWAISCFQVLERGTFLCPTNFSAMGFAIPSAIATQWVRPEQRAVCCVGDGGFLMSGFEILTAVRHQLPVIFCVFNDGALGITKGLQERIFKRTAFVDLKNPNFQKLAESLDLPYFKMSRDEEIHPVLEQAWALKKPVLVEVMVHYEKMSPFLKGIVMHRVKVTPWREKLHVARRWLRRTLLPNGNEPR
jgi:acetolactate synthase I/II/III large subunit